MKPEGPFCDAKLEDGGRVDGFLFHPDTPCPMSGHGYKMRGWQTMADALTFASERKEGRVAL
jgi:hypothetical protein